MINLISVVEIILFLFTFVQSSINLPGANVDQHDSIVVCYMENWSRFRVGEGRFSALSFDPRLCTHIIYGYAVYDNATSTIASNFPDLDHNEDEGGQNGYTDYVNLKRENEKLKVLLAVGYYSDGVQKYSQLVGDKLKRSTFIESVVEFLRKYRFDGLDFNWEYPATLEREGRVEDKINLPILLKELRVAFQKENPGWILTISIAASRYYISKAYNFAEIQKSEDFVNIKAQAYHGPWEKVTGFNAPLYPSQSRDRQNCVQDTVDMLMIDHNLKPSMLVLGIPAYAQTFTLDSRHSNSVGKSANEDGPKGPITSVANFMIYKEVCLELLKPGWQTVWDDEQKVPYSFNERSWISYDNEKSVTEKINFALSRELRGIMLNSIDMDDATGSCQSNKMPLLQTINNVLAKDYASFRNHIESSSGASWRFIQAPCTTLLITVTCLIFTK